MHLPSPCYVLQPTALPAPRRPAHHQTLIQQLNYADVTIWYHVQGYEGEGDVSV